MAGRQDIVNGAIYEADFGHWKPSDSEMVTIFTTAGLKPPTPADLKKFRTATGNVSVGGSSIAWCGIFATFALKHYGGLDVHWEYWKKGKKTGLVGPGVNWTGSVEGMRPGDVAVVRGPADKPTHHHFIVTAIDYAANTLQSVDGNSTHNEIVWHTNKKIRYANTSTDPDAKAAKTIYGHYKLNI
jgi:hypothetical protein